MEDGTDEFFDCIEEEVCNSERADEFRRIPSSDPKLYASVDIFLFFILEQDTPFGISLGYVMPIA